MKQKAEFNLSVFSKYILVTMFLTLSVFVVSYFLFKHESISLRNNLYASEDYKLRLQSQEIIHDFNHIQREVLFLRDLAINNDVCSCIDNLRFKTLEKEFLSYMEKETHFDQLRFIDNEGMELIRIQQSHGPTQLIEKNSLQDKSDRYYFQESKKLKLDRRFKYQMHFFIKRLNYKIF